MPITHYSQLECFEKSARLAMQVFNISKKFPKEETYSLSDQIRRSSRSVSANIGEGWTKRIYKNVFIRHLIDANGSLEETKIWLRFAKECGYISEETEVHMQKEYYFLGAMIGKLIQNWKNFSA